MNQIFLGEPSEYIRNWFVKKFYWPAYTTLNFVDGTTQTKEINGAATWENIGVKSSELGGNDTLSYCQLGKNVTEISSNTFYGCSSLTSVTIPNSVTSIGDRVFFDCNSLTSISVNQNNPRYDSRDNCNAIIETSSNALIQGCNNSTIPSSVTSIGDQAFGYCTSLTSVYIPSSVTSIGDQAFAFCSSLISIYIPSSVTYIANQEFSGSFIACDSLSSITVDPNNKRYDSRDNCNAIIETSSNKLIYGCGNSTIPNSVTTIGDYAFIACISLTSINIPSSVTYIGYYAFNNCISLTSINIPSSVTSIGDSAFYHCDSLSSIVIPNSITSISYQAFGYCTSLTSVYIPNSVTYIVSEAFDGCRSLPSISIPNSVTSIGSGAFGWCTSLTSVIFEGRTLEEISAMENYPFGLKTYVIIPGQFPTYTTLNFADGTTQIKEISGAATQQNIDVERDTHAINTTLTYCQLGKNVTEISDWAFYNCQSLTYIYIPSSVTSIRSDAFRQCYALTSIVIPNSVTSIGRPFSNCSSLTSVIFEGKTSSEITAMANYPFGIEDVSIIQAKEPEYNSCSSYRCCSYSCCSYSAFNGHETYTL